MLALTSTATAAGATPMLLLLLQVEFILQQPSPHTAVISSRFTLRPSAAAAAAADAAAGAGVGEFGGAHWFAQQEADSAAEAAADAATAAAAADGSGEGSAAVSGDVTSAGSDPDPSPEGEIHISSSIVTTSSGVITVSWEVDASQALPARLAAGLKPSLPRVGLQALLPHGPSLCEGVTSSCEGVTTPSLERVTWYGLGPQECYPDRKAAALLQQHSM